jgi:EAL domain-containing protein (putative c-di-GMP-specific phosphodiesterase class I)/GGDEF domain-containing protein
MAGRDLQAQDPGRQQLLLTQLPQRLTRLRQRGERLGPACWDINALCLLATDAALIAGACRTSENGELAASLDALHETISALLQPPRLPDHAAAARIAKLIENLSRQDFPQATRAATQDATRIAVEGPTHELDFPLLVTPPDEYWTHLAAAMPPSTAAASPAVTQAAAAAIDAAADTVAATPAIVATAAVVNPRRSIEQLMQRVSECLAMEDAASRAGGLLLFAQVDAGSRRDSLGDERHAAVLAEVGEFLATHVGRNDLVAATDNEHFLLLNPDCDPGLLEAYALNLRDRVARESFGGNANQRIAFDVGVCPFVAGATQARTMHDAARDAIDAAHAARRHGVFVVRKVEAAVDADLIERIRFALAGDGFQLLFQPIVSLRGEEDEQFQVLLRLQGDDQRLHTAAEVIPAAKRAGLAGAIDRWVLQRCVHLLGRRASGMRTPRLFVSLSLETMRDPDSPAWLGELLARHQVAGEAISVELQSADATRALADVRRHAIAMKSFGAGLTLSGFEAGVLGERLLQALPADFIKVSPRYLRLDDAATCSELRALVGRAQESGKRVIAPRVEDARGAAALWAAGVDFIQGNFVQQAGADLAFDFQAAVM